MSVVWWGQSKRPEILQRLWGIAGQSASNSTAADAATPATDAATAADATTTAADATTTAAEVSSRMEHTSCSTTTE